MRGNGVLPKGFTFNVQLIDFMLKKKKKHAMMGSMSFDLDLFQKKSSTYKIYQNN
jgi:hypothetical protein